jgi:hypothetical protein
MHVSQSKDHPLGITNPSTGASRSRSSQKEAETLNRSHTTSTTSSSRLISSHSSPLQRHKNNARLAIPLPTATTPELPPPNPRVPAQDSLATLAPQRQHQWLCLYLFQQPHAATATQFHEQRELRRVDTTKTTERLYFHRARASALLETRHQARTGRQSGCAHGEAQGDVSEEGAGGEGGSEV